MNSKKISDWKDKVLYTPGPLTTSKTVKQAMLRDVGHRESEFIGIVSEMRKTLLKIVQANEKDYVSIPLQGSGSYGIEAILNTASTNESKWLVIINGAYGRRISKMLEVMGVKKTELNYHEDQIPDIKDVEDVLLKDKSITHVALVHSETTTGLMNPLDGVAQLCKKHNKIFFVDAMSSYGAVPIDMPGLDIHYLVSTANKNIEGVPGFAFAIANKKVLQNDKGNADSLVLDLYDQWSRFEKDEQFRFSPPTHAILAFNQALKELEQEGGVKGRLSRYQENVDTLIAGMDKLGFNRYIEDELQGPIIVSFYYLDDPKFSFEKFYNYLNERGYVIYPGKVAKADLFRLATCGRLFKNDMLNIIAIIKEALEQMGIEI
jgi:2-aminoethylphosphonate-pyruvate transaminase